MYTYEDAVPVLGGLGALQTGTLPQGSQVLVPKGTVVAVIDARTPNAPKTGPLSNDMSLVLIGATAVQGDVEGRDLVSVGGQAALAYETGMLLPDPTVEGSAAASGRQVNVPAGTVVRITQLPYTGPPISPQLEPGPCPEGQSRDASGMCVAAVTTSPPTTTPWYKRGTTYVVGGGILLLVVIAAAAMRKR